LQAHRSSAAASCAFVLQFVSQLCSHQGSALLAHASAMQGLRKPFLQTQVSSSSHPTSLARHALARRQRSSLGGRSTVRQLGSQAWQSSTAGRCNLLLQKQHRPQAVPADQLETWDVVEYQLQPPETPSSTLRLGLVQQVSCSGPAQVQPRVNWGGEWGARQMPQHTCRQ
jgi:hypothetical protein